MLRWFIAGYLLPTTALLYGDGGAPLPPLTWPGAVRVLSEEPPIFLVPNFLSAQETERLILDYDVELLPEFERHANDTESEAFKRCIQRWPLDRCSALPDENDACDFHEDPEHYHSQAMAEIHGRVASILQLPEDHVEASWFFNWGQRTSQKLHLDNYHHYTIPKRVATVLIRLRPDPVGVVFPLARMALNSHPMAFDDVFVQELQREANVLHFKGSGGGRHFTNGPVHEAYLELCHKAPILLGQGEALIYYHLDSDGQVDVRALHASCPTEQAQSPKIFLAKFVRGGSLREVHDSLRTPLVPQEIRLWMDERRQTHGLDASVLVMNQEGEPLILDATLCQQPARSWVVLPQGATADPEAPPRVLCQIPTETEYIERSPGESFTVSFLLGNTGDRPWPEGTALSLREGVAMGAPIGLRLPEIPIGSVVDLKLPLISPEAPGTYSYGLWSLVDQDRVPFGALIWVDAFVPAARGQAKAPGTAHEAELREAEPEASELSLQEASATPEDAPRQEAAETEDAPRREAAENEEPPCEEATESEEPPREEAAESEDAPRQEAAETEDAPRQEVAETEEPPREEAAENEEPPRQEATEATAAEVLKESADQELLVAGPEGRGEAPAGDFFGCDRFWAEEEGAIYRELSTQLSMLPTVSVPGRGSPRLCLHLQHRFWLARLTVLKGPPEKDLIFGLCVPRGCGSMEEVRMAVAAPWVSQLYDRSGATTDRARLELKEWTRASGVSFVDWAWLALLLVPASVVTFLQLFGSSEKLPAGLQGFGFLSGVQRLTSSRATRPACLRLLATGCLVAYHVNQYPLYAPPGAPEGLYGFIVNACGSLHDPVFAVLSAQLLLGSMETWAPSKLLPKLARKWSRLVPVGLASRALLCRGVTRVSVIPFLLDIRPRLDGGICSGGPRCTHHVCTPLYGPTDAALSFPPLDHAGWFVEQDMVNCVLIVLLGSLLGSGQRVLVACGALALAAWGGAVVASLSKCVRSDGRVDGPCESLPYLPYVDLPLGSAFPITVVLWRLAWRWWSSQMNQEDAAEWDFLWEAGAFVGVHVAVQMELLGFPGSQGLPVTSAEPAAVPLRLWWLTGKLLLGLSLTHLCAGPSGDWPAPSWLAAADRLCFGICVVHVRVLELLNGYLRPEVREFTWITWWLDYTTVVFGAALLSLAIFLLVQAPCEVLSSSLAEYLTPLAEARWAALTAKKALPAAAVANGKSDAGAEPPPPAPRAPDQSPPRTSGKKR